MAEQDRPDRPTSSPWQGVPPETSNDRAAVKRSTRKRAGAALRAGHRGVSTARPPRRGRSLLGATGGMARLTGQGRVIDTSHPALDPPAEAMASERPGSLDRVVFGVTAVLVAAFVAWGALAPSSLSSTSGKGLTWVVSNTGWLFALAATGFVFFIGWLAISPYGRIPLGRDGEAPEFSTTSWVAMMFSAGMGIGLMFYGAAEPLAHFVTPPPGTGAAGNESAVRTAMATTLFHWGLHPWAIYAIVGVSIAYGVFRKGRPLTISAVFEPLLGKRQTYGPAGKVIDIFAIFATLFGSATSLGLGALQIAEGAEIVGWMGKAGNGFLVLLITGLTLCFILSAVSGVGKGIQYLSNVNMVLALVLAFFVFVAGPTVFILNLVPTTLGTYLQTLMEMSARSGAGGPAQEKWLAGWTIFYWAWWISWTPFVGMFIARISKGRTIREFVLGVLLVPSLLGMFWLTVFGGTAMHLELFGGGGVVEAVNQDVTLALYKTVELMHWETFGWIAKGVLTLLICTYFITSSDSGTLVITTLLSIGDQDPPVLHRAIWGLGQGLVAAILLVSGGLAALQAASIIAALPFSLIMLAMCYSLMQGLKQESQHQFEYRQKLKRHPGSVNLSLLDRIGPG